MKTAISAVKAPSAIGPYSQAIKYGDMIFLSGQLPLNAENGCMPDGIEEQTRQVLENIKFVLEAQSLSLESIVKTTVFLKDMSHFAKMNGIYDKYFRAPYPARSTVQVAALPKDALIEIECIAVDANKKY
ncbi:MAG: RidA family protein [Christensenellaceae bacterium]|jgi:2-iminobutanoate/2-iminopropanoate deaminase|nr:RidA family protein [Christensenellaceae bacterium]